MFFYRFLVFFSWLVVIIVVAKKKLNVNIAEGHQMKCVQLVVVLIINLVQLVLLEKNL